MATVDTDDLDRFEQRIEGREVSSEQTAKTYRRWAERFEAWRPGGTPDEGMLRDFDSLLQDDTRTDYPWENAVGRPAPREYAYRSRVVVASAIKLYLRTIYNTEITAKPQNIVYGDPEPFDPHYLSYQQVEQIFDCARDDCKCQGCEAAIRLGYDAILRGAEAAAVRRDDLDLDRGTLKVRPVKGSRQATLSLADETVDALQSHFGVREENHTFAFTNTYGSQWTPGAFNKHFWQFHHEAGSHATFRHSAILHALEYPERFHWVDETQSVFGQVYRRARHHSPDMTANYAQMVGVDVPDWEPE